jgi:heterodisulfide reductase subunit C
MNEYFPWRRPVKINLPSGVKPQLIRHFSIGLLYPITEETLTYREKAGLRPLPPTAHQFPEAANDIRTLIKAMKVDKAIGLDLDTMEYLSDDNTR